ncbi:MAG: hypothetical protein IPK53_07730 [bacterium]|nr:hypothetical protein [bacterium]
MTDVNTGWPLYAGITIAGYPGGTVWTDPVTALTALSCPAARPSISPSRRLSVAIWLKRGLWRLLHPTLQKILL